MSSLFYFGAQPHGTQKVSDEVRSKGLGLLRIAPSAVFPLITRDYTLPQYELYCNYFHLFVKSVITKAPVSIGTSTEYYPLPTKATPSFIHYPTISWDYDEKKDADTMSMIRGQFNATELALKGRNLLSASLSPTQMVSLMKTGPNIYAPCTTTTINIDAYKVYLQLMKIADLFLRINQYPLVKYEATTVTNIEKFVVIDTPSSKLAAVAGQTYQEMKAGAMMFRGTLPEPDLSKVDYYARHSKDIVNDGGLLFPYVKELAKSDSSIVARCLERYFFEMLGSDEAGARKAFSTIKSAWGNLKDTMWGDVVSHLFAGIEVAFQTGGMMDIMLASGSSYGGFIIYGGGFELSQGDRIYKPVSFKELQEGFNTACPHTQALQKIASMINFGSDMERQGFLSDARCMLDVSRALLNHGYDMLDAEMVKEAAKDLNFAADVYLPCNSMNVARVLNAIVGDKNLESSFPLHRLAVLETDKAKRLLSAFGAYAPSFRVPGGRTLSLESQVFKYTVKGSSGRKKSEKETTRVFCQTVPWAQACRDLAVMIAEKSVLSPIGTPLAASASSRSLITEFEGVGGTAVLAALRTVAGVSLSLGGGSESKKRKNDQEEGGSKKAKIAENLDDWV